MSVSVVLDRSPDALDGAVSTQYRILEGMNVSVTTSDASDVCSEADTVVDSLIGYGLQGAPRGRTQDLIDLCNDTETPTVSLDVPSGLDATTGERPGLLVESDEILTLALPKTGLREIESRLYLGDISIPRIVYDRVGIEYETPFRESYCVAVER
ncbi:NAD(P)H-hydrate epimerase [Halorussus limi]|uniref:NAD(P)H-hydrate epimerase n=1 Tax=Halorussus limi TaxID=2938695 RepID=UPI0034A35D68